MELTELRIGNKLMYEFKEGWKEINVSLNDFKYGFDKCFNKYEPIPLTEEWLLKSEFVKSKKTLTKNYISKCGLVTIYKMPNGKIFANGVVEDTYLPYMHTLQNLYFTLTNKELTTK